MCTNLLFQAHKLCSRFRSMPSALWWCIMLQYDLTRTLRGVTTQKTTWIFTTVETSNLTPQWMKTDCSMHLKLTWLQLLFVITHTAKEKTETNQIYLNFGTKISSTQERMAKPLRFSIQIISVKKDSTTERKCLNQGRRGCEQCVLFINHPTNSMKQSPSRANNSHSAIFPAFYGTLRYIHFHKSPTTCPYPEPGASTPQLPTLFP